MTKPYRTHLFERLQTQEDRVGYLRAAFEEGEVTFALAVQDVCNSVNFATPTPTKPSDAVISSQFHKIWTSQVGTEGYDKDQWQKLRTLLDQRGVRV